LLEGQEISEVNYSYVKKNDVFRVDSNYFQKTFLAQERNILKTKHQRLIEFGCDLKSFGAYSLNNYVEYLDEGIPFVRGINLKNGRISFNDVIYISKEANALLWKSEVHPKTILLSMSGTIGDVAIASESLEYPINSNQDIAKIACPENLNPYYLYAFLSSYFGQNYLIREARGSVQQHVFLSQIENFPIPEFSEQFYEAIEGIIKLADSSDSKSCNAYQQAENSLLKKVGLADFEPSTQNTNIKTFAQSFNASGRLDAEYYQPKYEEMVAKIEQQHHAKLADIVAIKKSIEPGSDAYAEDGLPFIRVSDYSKYGFTTPDKCLSDVFVQENKTQLENLKPKAGTILFSKDGSVGAAYLLREDLDGVTSGAVLHLVIKRDDILPEYLTLVLNSKLVQMQAERDAGGSIILHWRVAEIENVVLPIIDLACQIKISQLVQQSFSLKVESERLLNVAKRAVEIAIEQDEAAGFTYIRQESWGL
jgi:type I restriction enzyme, S subunit